MHAPTNGFIRSIEVKEGGHVEAGSPVAVLASREIRARLARVEIERDRLVVQHLDGASVAERDRLGSLEAQRRRLCEAVEVSSPISGIVVTPRLEDRGGEIVSNGDEIADVADLSRMRMEIDIPEDEVPPAGEGFGVSIRLFARPTRTFEGIVESVSSIRADRAERRLVRVVAIVDNADLVILDGMSGYARLESLRAKP